MAVVITEEVRKIIRKSVPFLQEFFKDTGKAAEEAYSVTMFTKTRDCDSFLETLYALAGVDMIDYIDDKKIKLSNDVVNKCYYAVHDNIIKLFNEFKEANFPGEDRDFYVGVREVVYLYMLECPEEAQGVFQISYEKYCQLVELLRERIVSDYTNGKEVKKPTTGYTPPKEVEGPKESFRGGKKGNGKKPSFGITRFGAEDLTAKDYQHNPLVGNQQALRKAIKGLMTGNSLIILGEAGVGKTTLVKGIAYNIKMKTVPKFLQDKRIISLPLVGIIANTKYAGELEEHVQDVIHYAKSNKNAIYYMDEFHMIMGAGLAEDSNMDVANLFKEHIADRTMQIIGATTKQEFDKTIATDPAFRRRFKTMTLSEPTEEEVFLIAEQYIKVKEEETKIEWPFNNDFLHKLVELTTSRNRKSYETINNPDITLRIIDDIYASSLYYERMHIEKQDVIESLEDNEILSQHKKEKLIAELSKDEHYGEQTGKSKILVFPSPIIK